MEPRRPEGRTVEVGAGSRVASELPGPVVAHVAGHGPRRLDLRPLAPLVVTRDRDGGEIEDIEIVMPRGGRRPDEPNRPI